MDLDAMKTFCRQGFSRGHATRTCRAGLLVGWSVNVLVTKTKCEFFLLFRSCPPVRD